MVAVTSFFKFSQPAAGKKQFGENTAAETSFRDEERKRSMRQKNWKFNFFLKNEKKKNNSDLRPQVRTEQDFLNN